MAMSLGNGYLNHDDSEVEETVNSLQNEVDRLKKENSLLQERLGVLSHLLALDNHLLDEVDKPLALLLIPDNDLARHLRSRLEEAVASLPHTSQAQVDQNKKLDSEANYQPVYQPVSFDFYDTATFSKKHHSTISQRVRKKMLYNAFVAYQNFFVDCNGQPLVCYDPNLTDGWQIPWYVNMWSSLIGDDEAKPSKGKKLTLSCFNCGGAHNLKECGKKRDLVRISQNRQSFMDKFGAAPGLGAKSTRYHVETEKLDTRFAKFQPGKLSPELLRALRLSNSQLPLHIYRMRSLGYPPGWLKEAEVESSGLGIFHGYDTDFAEDGEIMDINKDEPKAVTYDIDRLLKYPGFNVEPPSGVYDQCQQMQPPQPPMQKHQQLLVWTLFFDHESQKRAMQLDESERAIKRRKLYEEDMDIESDAGPTMPIELPPPPLPPDEFEEGEKPSGAPSVEDEDPNNWPVTDEEGDPPGEVPTHQGWWSLALERFVEPADVDEVGEGIDSAVDTEDEEGMYTGTEDENLEELQERRAQLLKALDSEKAHDSVMTAIRASRLAATSAPPTTSQPTPPIEDGEISSAEQSQEPFLNSEPLDIAADDPLSSTTMVMRKLRTFLDGDSHSFRRNIRGTNNRVAFFPDKQILSSEAQQLVRDSGTIQSYLEDEGMQVAQYDDDDDEDDEESLHEDGEIEEGEDRKLPDVMETKTPQATAPTTGGVDAHVISASCAYFSTPEQKKHADYIRRGLNHSRSAKGLPEYWKFSAGIEPYEAKEELPVMGVYKKLLSTLKRFGKSK